MHGELIFSGRYPAPWAYSSESTDPEQWLRGWLEEPDCGKRADRVIAMAKELSQFWQLPMDIYDAPDQVTVEVTLTDTLYFPEMTRQFAALLWASDLMSTDSAPAHPQRCVYTLFFDRTYEGIL